MSSSFDNSRHSSPDSNDNSAGKPQRHRRRTPISCTPCRKRKIRCDRQFPCGPCIARNQPDEPCLFVGGIPQESTIALQQRIHELEEHVKMLSSAFSNGNLPSANYSLDSTSPFDAGNASNTFSSDNESLLHGFVRLKIGEKGESRHLGNTAIMSSFVMLKHISHGNKGVKDEFMNRRIFIKKIPKWHKAMPLSAMPFLETIDEVLPLRPPKEVCDYLVARYFKAVYPLGYIIYKPKFSKYYGSAWGDPTSVRLSFYALLFAMMSTALYTFDEDDPFLNRLMTKYNLGPTHRELYASLLETCEKCLVGCKFMQKGDPLCLHAVLIISAVDDADACKHIWLEITGFMSRSMGLYRDPAMFAGQIDVKVGEHRKRAFAAISIATAEQLITCPLSTPLATRTRYDCPVPGNYNDDDIEFGDLTPKPDSMFTDSSFLIWRVRLSRLYEFIEENSYRMPFNHVQLLLIDKQIQAFEESLPIFYKRADSSSTQAISDIDIMIVQRYSLQLQLLVTKIHVHQLSFFRRFNDKRYMDSWLKATEYAETAITMTLELIERFDMLRPFAWYIDNQISIVSLSVSCLVSRIYYDRAHPCVPEWICLLRKFFEYTGKDHPRSRQLYKIHTHLMGLIDILNEVEQSINAKSIPAQTSMSMPNEANGGSTGTRSSGLTTDGSGTPGFIPSMSKNETILKSVTEPAWGLDFLANTDEASMDILSWDQMVNGAEFSLQDFL